MFYNSTKDRTWQGCSGLGLDKARIMGQSPSVPQQAHEKGQALGARSKISLSALMASG